MVATKTVEKIVKKVGLDKKYRIIENKRILLNRKPKVFYQPDFALIGEKGFIVVEIELTTDAVKQLVGDIVRAGFINATHFLGIVGTKSARRTVENYGEILTKRIHEMSRMKVISILFRGKEQLKRDIEAIL